LTYLLKEELFTFANMVPSRFSELFIRMEMLNIGQQISSVHQNPIENRSKISGGISKSTTEALSSVAASRDARDAKKLSNEVIFFFHSSKSRVHSGNAFAKKRLKVDTSYSSHSFE